MINILNNKVLQNQSSCKKADKWQNKNFFKMAKTQLATTHYQLRVSYFIRVFGEGL